MKTQSTRNGKPTGNWLCQPWLPYLKDVLFAKSGWWSLIIFAQNDVSTQVRKPDLGAINNHGKPMGVCWMLVFTSCSTILKCLDHPLIKHCLPFSVLHLPNSAIDLSTSSGETDWCITTECLAVEVDFRLTTLIKSQRIRISCQMCARNYKSTLGRRSAHPSRLMKMLVSDSVWGLQLLRSLIVNIHAN